MCVYMWALIRAKANKDRGPGSLTAENSSQILQICTHKLAWAWGSQLCQELSHVFPPCWLCKCLEGLDLS